MLLTIIFLALGFLLLIKGADWFVGGASDLAKILRIPTIIIGLTIVSIGTSLPEACVSITASLKGVDDIATGNVIGSNIFNLLVVAGLSAVIKPISIDRDTIRRDFPFSIVCAAILAFCMATLFFGKTTPSIGRIDGIIMLVILIAYMTVLIRDALKFRQTAGGEETAAVISLPVSLGLIVLGVICIILGGNLVVDAATTIARTFGLSENLIGLTIVACGTSLPELVTSMVAAKKGDSDIAMGNVVGSNIFNILFILGASSVISPLKASETALVDMSVLIVVSLITWAFIAKKKKVTRPFGGLMFLTYVVYLIYIIGR